MTNLQSHPKVAPELTANSVGAPNATTSDEALESLRHNQTHTLPPGARVAWLSHRLQDLPEEHLRATDDLRRDSENAAKVPSEGALCARSSRRRVPIAVLAGLAAALAGAIAFYVFAREPTSAKQPMQVTTQVTVQANPASTANALTKSEETEGNTLGTSERSAPGSPSVTSNAPGSRSVAPMATTPPRVSASEGHTREPVAAPRLRESSTQDKLKQATPSRKTPIKTDTPPAEPKPAVDEILFKSR